MPVDAMINENLTLLYDGVCLIAPLYGQRSIFVNASNLILLGVAVRFIIGL